MILHIVLWLKLTDATDTVVATQSYAYASAAVAAADNDDDVGPQKYISLNNVL